jgi:hypothetical protein
MEGVRLLDIVQLCCRTAVTGCLEVRNGRGTGLLWLRCGEIVHAESGALRGEDAALAILTLRYGDFALRRHETAPTISISVTWESLVMRAACALDESPVRTEAELSNPAAADARSPALTAGNPALPVAAATAGEDSQMLADLVGLGETVHRLASDVGEALGLGGPVAVYGWGKAHRVMLEIGEDGSARLSTDRLEG